MNPEANLPELNHLARPRLGVETEGLGMGFDPFQAFCLASRWDYCGFLSFIIQFVVCYASLDNFTLWSEITNNKEDSFREEKKVVRLQVAN